MKKITKILFLCLIMLFTFVLTSCGQGPIEEDIILSDEVKDLYGKFDAINGLDLYCYKKDGTYKAILLNGRAHKSQKEKVYSTINNLLDKSITLPDMKKVLDLYEEGLRENATIYVMPCEDRYTPGDVYKNMKNDDYIKSVIDVKKQLGLSTNDNNITEVKLNGISDINTVKCGLVDSTIKLELSTKPQDASYKSCNWISTDPSVAKVDNNGNVSCLKEGYATIKINIDGYVIEQTIYVAKEYDITKPEGYDLDFWLLDDVETVNLDGYQQDEYTYSFLDKPYEYIPIEQSSLKELPEAYILYEYAGYPDYSFGGKKILCITIKDQDVTIFGLKLKDGVAAFDKYFTDLGYKVEIEESKHIISFEGYSIIYTESFMKIEAKYSNANNVILYGI